ncbi:Pectinesterase, catalytic [Corchorus olitorius]|uniref:Pectinesterase, catalytic n=1 Tax=Corchorus olitorius TaxID=93759 RepID=A0A1R3IV13_9ROSI|nr:Pectinesterase, catalytic [Corchorus olitorius]
MSLWIKSEGFLSVLEAPINVTVAMDGSGDYKTIMEAIKAAPSNSKQYFSIYIRKGVYKQYVQIDHDETNILMKGDGMNGTIISGDHNNASAPLI